ncbi:hypothetical protein T265_06994 [Opisthorchis viverrini]|uniref:protein-histidine N-methyltransferase n=1 Tax=Opisthorchis viverrini TaxID=6198 RepID=A0A075ACS0_OPIVI|nr:hypothetical protein T265_06994 [Opisthorchis viverrini]KER25594.1 hypothetical protein T265_06994 [Opisthorchis viverrini]
MNQQFPKVAHLEDGSIEYEGPSYECNSTLGSSPTICLLNHTAERSTCLQYNFLEVVRLLHSGELTCLTDISGNTDVAVLDAAAAAAADDDDVDDDCITSYLDDFLFAPFSCLTVHFSLESYPRVLMVTPCQCIGPRNFSKSVKRKSDLIAKDLLEICLETTVTAVNARDVFLKLYSLSEDLINVQSKFCSLRILDTQHSDRIEAINRFLVLHKHHIHQPVFSHFFTDCGPGLCAESDIQENACVLRIPVNLMLDVTTGCSKEFSEFIKRDPICSVMENVALSLRLLHELCLSSESNYRSYIYTLPTCYHTFMYMKPEDLCHLRGSKTLELVVSNFQSVCRQYAYFLSHLCGSGLPFERCFCFEDYRWAVSTIMSRNNLIPKEKGGAVAMCLVPIWDLINHKLGQVTTDFDPESGELIFYAMESTPKNTQILMDYGKRTSAEFLMFSGFVPETNPHNNVRIVLGVSKSDQLSSKREQLLNLIALQSPLTLHITGDSSSLSDAIAFDQLDAHLSMTTSALHALRTSPLCPGNPIDDQAIAFLTMRFELLVSAYGPMVSEDEVGYGNLTPIQRYCERLRVQEVQILRSCIECLHRRHCDDL